MHIHVPVHVSHTDAMPAPLLSSDWDEHLPDYGSMPSWKLAQPVLYHSRPQLQQGCAVQSHLHRSPAALTLLTLIADTPGSSPPQMADSALHKRGRSADVDEQSSPRRSKKPKPAGTDSTSCNLPCTPIPP